MKGSQITNTSPQITWHHRHATAKASFKPKKEFGTSQWSVILRTFYRQILSLLYGSFFFWNFRHRLARELLVIYDVFLRYVEQITFLPDEMSTTLLCFIWMTWKQANPMKFPLLLKAAFGGGGRGQAVVANEACKGLHLQRLNLRRFPHSFVWSRLTLQKSLRNVARRLKWALS